MSGSIDTIAAIATPLGVASLGVIRLSGPQAIQIVSRIFSNPVFSRAPSHTIHYGEIISSDHIIDRVVAALFRQPRSFTGEDVVEISCHGSPHLLKEVLHCCMEQGARLACPGEFSQRAFLNGKMDLAQAEAVASLIQARSAAERRQALDQLKGVLSKRIEALRSKAIDILAHLEANLDFSEDEVPAIEWSSLQKQTRELTADLQALLKTGVKGRYLKEGIHVVLVGRPNVGKSSLFNAFLASERAIVTDIPGTTRDMLSELLEWDGASVVLIDTAGLRKTSDRLEEMGMQRTRMALETAQVVLYVIDASMELSQNDKELLCEFSPQKTIAVLNKADCPAKVDPFQIHELGFKQTVVVSALTGQGLSELQHITLKIGFGSEQFHENEAIIVQARHLDQLERAQNHFGQALYLLENKPAEEAVALEIRAGLEQLSAITGEVVSEELLNRIFSTFCIGK